jgi:outer membrane protein OmpA-like peptidoglycan-associated protein
MFLAGGLLILSALLMNAADLPGSKDPPGMKRYEGSEIIGYREPKFDEFLLPLGPPTEISPPKYARSQAVDGQVSRYTYIAPPGRTSTELLRNYRLESQRLGLEIIYEKKAGERGWFGPTFAKLAEEDGLSQILEYNEADEKLLVGKSRAAKPAYYMVFVTSYKDGVIPERLQSVVQKDRALAEVVIIAPDVMEQKMIFLSAEEMGSSIRDDGKVLLYGILFDVDKDVLKAESQPTLAEIVKLLKNDPTLRLHVVGHTDNQGKPDYNLDLSRRRAASVVQALTSQGIGAHRLDSFGCGVYAPVAANRTDEGRAKNRRVELIPW